MKHLLTKDFEGVTHKPWFVEIRNSLLEFILQLWICQTEEKQEKENQNLFLKPSQDVYELFIFQA